MKTVESSRVSVYVDLELLQLLILVLQMLDFEFSIIFWFHLCYDLVLSAFYTVVSIV